MLFGNGLAALEMLHSHAILKLENICLLLQTDVHSMSQKRVFAHHMPAFLPSLLEYHIRYTHTQGF